jgi:hypothetical protein
LEFKGTVTITSSQGKDRAAAIFATVYESDRISLAADAIVTLGFRSDGHLERLKTAGMATAGQDGCEPRSLVEILAVSPPQRTVAAKAIRGASLITQGGVALMRGSGSKSPAPLVPIVDSTVITDRPAFRWPAVPRAHAYTVIVSGGGNKIWTHTVDLPPASYTAERPLRPGLAYDWEVVAIGEDGTLRPAFEGRFRIATSDQAADAAAFRGLAESTEVPLLTLAAQWYARSGMIAEAIAVEERLTQLAADPVPFYVSLEELYRLGGRRGDAEQAHRKAKRP